MKIRDQNVHNAAYVGRKVIPITLVTAISQAAVVAFKLTPGTRFQITKVKSYCLAAVATVTATVKVGGRVAASVTFTSATEVDQVLSTVLANLRGTATEAITIEYTTNGTGALTNGHITIEYRSRPQAGDLGPV